ncbi:MAG TPA: universal stress protein [Xanthobacteraceae bacterium]|nr:universal stress protein [Xanthobacteraceae bacterium]
MRILAATDFSTRSNRALRQAGLLAQPSGAELHIAGLEKARIESYVASEQRQATEALASFVAANDLKGFQRALRVDELRPDLLVLGTHGRSGVVKALIGSVTEEALRSLEVDIWRSRL